jgi:uncharacterized protein YjbI with pentapeptide repeats
VEEPKKGTSGESFWSLRGRRTQITGEDFSGVALHWARLDAANFEGAILEGATLRHVPHRANLIT